VIADYIEVLTGTLMRLGKTLTDPLGDFCDPYRDACGR